MLIQGSDYFVNEMRKLCEQCGPVLVFGVIPYQGAVACGDLLCEKLWKGGRSIRVNHVQTGGSLVVSGRSMVT